MMRASRPVPYSPMAWWRDRQAARKDGKRGVFHPLLGGPDHNQQQLSAGQLVVAPYVAGLHRRFGEQASRLRSRVAATVEAQVAEREACTTQIRSTQEQLVQVRTVLADFPVLAPAEVLARRNTLELDKPEELIIARNQREWDARRSIHVQEEAGLRERLRTLQQRVAVLDGEIVAVEMIGAALVRRQHEHACRRTRTYQQHLLRTHADGASVLAVLEFTGPPLPAWVERFTQDAPADVVNTGVTAGRR